MKKTLREEILDCLKNVETDTPGQEDILLDAVADLEGFIADLLEKKTKEEHDKYNGTNQDDEYTKGCDQYHNMKDLENERSAR